MFNRDRWQEIFQTISKNKLRTFLSGFTVALGIFIFVILFGLGNGLKNTFESFFLNDATNLIWVYRGRTSMPYKGFKSNRQIEFKNDDIADIKYNFGMYMDYISPGINRNQKIKYKNEYNNYSIQAIAPGYQFAEKVYLMEGRFINEDDTQNQEKYTVIGRLVRDDLFGKKSPLGEYVDVGGSMFKVIGVFQDDGGDNEERRIYIPYTTRQLMDKNTDKLDQFVIGFKPEIGYTGAMMFEEKLRQFLKDKHQIHPDDRRGIFIRNVADNLQQNQQFASVLQIIVTFVGLGTLMAGIIGISNIMVFVVKERTKELGIRKALGATPRSVIAMILQESIFITTIAGYIGLFAGILILNSLGVTLEDYFIKNPYIDMQTGIFATVILIIFGAIAGYIPARRAARIKPIVALRDE
ncbi:ABC transporter permease [Reichenbachiella agariperforans]|uniref:Putative ABC transport system permease protein n=1 Tax=Reichenbachiella agariperforans TaxID=156994 RepID=A0A1M6KME5_REIAG|nr:ABC transporter permease [Reichenbachiella agariperforans]MBU2913614.1 ABC transporter permease [Reichenbachiella agariperforans]SHJ60129.1 putative ABC transport system permease protein [Reichenbachiella agariperforans]